MKAEQISISLDAVEQLKKEIQNEVENKFYLQGLQVQEAKMKEQDIDALLDFFKPDGKPLGKTAINIHVKAIKSYIEALNKQIALLRGYANFPTDEEVKEQPKQGSEILDFDWFN